MLVLGGLGGTSTHMCMRTFFQICSTVVTVLVGAGALFVLGSLLPIEGNYDFWVVESGSMEPAIKTGAVVAVLPREQYAVGDVITFAGTERNPTPITHRIVGTRLEEGILVYETQGDANEEADLRWIREEEISGTVFFSVPYAGYVSVFFGTPTGKATIAVGTILLIGIMFVPWGRLVKEKEEAHTT